MASDAAKIAEQYPGSRTARLLAEDEEAEQDTGSGRRMDAELKIVGAILRLLDDLDGEDARRRVMEYLHARYNASKA